MKMVRQSASDRRLTLLQAALDLFSTQGYDGTTTRAIAERVGVTEALLFKHFRTKQELLRAVVEEFGPRRMFPPLPAALQKLPLKAALERLITQYLDTFWENRACLRMMLLTSERDQGVFDELRIQFGRQALDLYTFLHERVERHEILPDSAGAATDIISAATGGFLQRSLGQEPEKWEIARTMFVSNLLQILLRGIQSQKEESFSSNEQNS